MKLARKHPFIASLAKLSIRIWVVIFSVGLAIGGIALVIAMAASSTGSGGDGGYSLSTSLQHVSGDAASPNKLLSLKVSGVLIGDTDDTGSLSNGDIPVSGYAVKDALYQAASDDSIKGVVLEINSPGGTIYGAHAIADGVAYFRTQTHKPVYAYVQGLAASGAYWAAVSTDKIIADYGSDVGSIGVISGPYTYYDNELSDGSVVTQNGIHDVNITAGTSKDIGNPYRKLTADETAKIQQSVNDDYDLFVSFVSNRRHISETDIRSNIGAMTYGNKVAQSLKLIDQSGGRQDAYAQLATAAKLSDDDYEVVGSDPTQDATAASSSPLNSMLHRGSRTSSRAASSKGCSLNRANLAYYGDVTGLCRH